MKTKYENELKKLITIEQCYFGEPEHHWDIKFLADHSPQEIWLMDSTYSTIKIYQVFIIFI